MQYIKNVFKGVWGIVGVLCLRESLNKVKPNFTMVVVDLQLVRRQAACGNLSMC